MGESSEEFTNYWLSRFPLLLVHTWLKMQCVANETAFLQYYPNNYHYPELNYADFEMLQSLDENIENDDLIAEERADFMSKKNPKKLQKVSFYEHRRHQGKRMRNFGGEDDENKSGLGLYRNLSADNVGNGTEISTKDNLRVKNRVRKSPNIRHRPKKQVEEPLVWKMSEDK